MLSGTHRKVRQGEGRGWGSSGKADIGLEERSKKEGGTGVFPRGVSFSLSSRASEPLGLGKRNGLSQKSSPWVKGGSSQERGILSDPQLGGWSQRNRTSRKGWSRIHSPSPISLLPSNIPWQLGPAQQNGVRPSLGSGDQVHEKRLPHSSSNTGPVMETDLTEEEIETIRAR